MAVTEVAVRQYRAQQIIARRTSEQAQELWRGVEPKNVLNSWVDRLGEMFGILTKGQVAAASLSQGYLNSLAVAQGINALPTGQINPLSFAGVAADGRPLRSLLMQPALRSLGMLAKGADDATALRSGLASLVRIADTEVADASRAANHVGMVANRTWVKYVRLVTLPACGRCIILAGREYSWSTGFERHPQCDCTNVPIHEGDAALATPEELFARMSPAEQSRAFTVSGAEAIRLGADIGQVTNARRGMQTSGGRLVTTEGTTVRGVAGRRMGSTSRRKSSVRPMPEQLLLDAAGDRDLAIHLLRQYGYLDSGSARRNTAAQERITAAKSQPAAPVWNPAPTLTPEQAAAAQQKLPPWTDAQHEALLEYTAGWAGPINDLLRNGGEATDLVKQFTKDAKSAMGPLPASTLFRYVSPEAFGKAQVEDLSKLVGKTIQERGFQSTSIAADGHTDPNNQMRLAARRQVRMEIDVPDGTSGAYVDGISAHPGQLEVILDAGLKYRVIQVVTEGRYTVVRVQVVP